MKPTAVLIVALMLGSPVLSLAQTAASDTNTTAPAPAVGANANVQANSPTSSGAGATASPNLVTNGNANAVRIVPAIVHVIYDWQQPWCADQLICLCDLDFDWHALC